MHVTLFVAYVVIYCITLGCATRYISLWILAIATLGWLACISGILFHYMLPLTYGVYTAAYAGLLSAFVIGLACQAQYIRQDILYKLLGCVGAWGVVVAAVTETLL